MVTNDVVQFPGQEPRHLQSKNIYLIIVQNIAEKVKRLKCSATENPLSACKVAIFINVQIALRIPVTSTTFSTNARICGFLAETLSTFYSCWNS